MMHEPDLIMCQINRSHGSSVKTKSRANIQQSNQDKQCLTYGQDKVNSQFNSQHIDPVSFFKGSVCRS